MPAAHRYKQTERVDVQRHKCALYMRRTLSREALAAFTGALPSKNHAHRKDEWAMLDTLAKKEKEAQTRFGGRGFRGQNGLHTLTSLVHLSTPAYVHVYHYAKKETRPFRLPPRPSGEAMSKPRYLLTQKFWKPYIIYLLRSWHWIIAMTQFKKCTKEGELLELMSTEGLPPLFSMNSTLQQYNNLLMKNASRVEQTAPKRAEREIFSALQTSHWVHEVIF